VATNQKRLCYTLIYIMEFSAKRWQIATTLTPEADHSLAGFPQPLRQILFNRGYTTPTSAANFLAAAPPDNTEPHNLLGIQEAIPRIAWSITNCEKIAIYGDYDVDGVTATALLVQVLSALGSEVEGYIPNRFDEGYGLNNEALDYLCDCGIRLVITVDCGVRSLQEANHAEELGLDLIITDHHHPGEELPQVFAVINSKQLGDNYPDKDLAGVGLAFKLAKALVDHFKKSDLSMGKDINDADILDLVALGTVADLAPLVGENRTLVRTGLESLRQPRRQGIQALIGVCGLLARRIRAVDIGFILGPRLNAAGRLDSALAAFELLTTQDINKAGKLAQQLDNQNRERQVITREIQARAEQIALAEDPDALLLFAADPEFNPGVVGLAASRLSERYYRPAIVAFEGHEFTRGSCRSIPEFHITDALDRCEELLIRHGGHAAAAGFTVRNENLPQLVERLRAISEEQLSDKDLRPVMHADFEIQLSDLLPEILDQLEMLQPTGYGNPQAKFVSYELKVKDHRLIGKEGNHLKLILTDGWITYDAIAFNQGFWHEEMPKFVDVLYTFERNEFNGIERLQLKVQDLKPAGTHE
jgi:single-stranded-DNA-specific exonuclease